MKKSAFAEWFKEQYGSVPSEEKRQQLQRRFDDAEIERHAAKVAYESEMRLHGQWQDALYGWNARGSR